MPLRPARATRPSGGGGKLQQRKSPHSPAQLPNPKGANQDTSPSLCPHLRKGKGHWRSPGFPAQECLSQLGALGRQQTDRALLMVNIKSSATSLWGIAEIHTHNAYCSSAWNSPQLETTSGLTKRGLGELISWRPQGGGCTAKERGRQRARRPNPPTACLCKQSYCVGTRSFTYIYSCFRAIRTKPRKRLHGLQSLQYSLPSP